MLGEREIHLKNKFLNKNYFLSMMFFKTLEKNREPAKIHIGDDD